MSKEPNNKIDTWHEILMTIIFEHFQFGTNTHKQTSVMLKLIELLEVGSVHQRDKYVHLHSIVILITMRNKI